VAGKRRKIGKSGKKPAKPTVEPPRGKLKSVTVSRTDYKHVEGFCKIVEPRSTGTYP
jgi:hypothetical protein